MCNELGLLSSHLIVVICRSHLAVENGVRHEDGLVPNDINAHGGLHERRRVIAGTRVFAIPTR